MDYGIELHPWDIAEEGLEQTLAQIASLGASRLSLTAAWPGQAVMRPRAPAERLQFPDRGAVYFKPDAVLWKDARLRPNVAKLVMVDDIFGTLPVRAQREGLAVEARVVFLPYVPQPAEAPVAPIGPEAKPFRPETLYVRNAFGDRLPGYLCPSRAEVRRYFAMITGEVSRYDVASLAVESFGFPTCRIAGAPGGGVIEGRPAAELLMGLCFCEACTGRAEAEGIETSPLAWRVRNFLERVLSGEPGGCPDVSEGAGALREIDEHLPSYLSVRDEAVVMLLREMRNELREGVRLVLFAGSRPPAVSAWQEGGSVSLLAGEADEVRLHGDTGDTTALVRDMAEARDDAAGKAALSVRLRPGPPSNPAFDDFAERVSVSGDLGAQGVTFAAYGELAHAHLKWIPRVTGG